MRTPVIIVRTNCIHTPMYVESKAEIRVMAFCPICSTPLEVETEEVELKEKLEKKSEEKSDGTALC